MQGPALEARGAELASHFDSMETKLARPLPWWTSPAGLCIGFLLPVLLLIASLGGSNHPGLTIRGLRFLDAGYLAMGAGLILLAALAGWLGTWWRPARGEVSANLNDWDRGAMLVAVVALAAYAFWFRDYLTSPALLLDTLRGAHRPERSSIELTPGITSLANFTPAFFSVFAFRWLLTEAKLPRGMKIAAALLVVLTAFRVYVWSERLALIEALVPFALALGARLAASPRPALRTLVAAGPVIALPLLLMYFGVAEYVRSWSSPTYSGKLGFWEFASGRLASYYYTSLNNGAGLLATAEWPSFTFEHTLFWLHRAPLQVGPAFTQWLDLTAFGQERFLERFADPEFNNPSGLYAIVSDLGLPLGAAYFAAIAFAAGVALGAYARGGLAGVLVYPMLFLSFLEVYRYPYLGQPRAFTWVVGMVTVAAVVGASAAWRPRTPRSRPLRAA
jgi:hypothetical protein